MKEVNAENLKIEINRLRSFKNNSTVQLSLTEEFHLKCLEKLYETMLPQVLKADLNLTTEEQRNKFIESMQDGDSSTLSDRLFSSSPTTEFIKPGRGTTSAEKFHGK